MGLFNKKKEESQNTADITIKGKPYKGPLCYCTDPFLVKIPGFYAAPNGQIDPKRLLLEQKEGENVIYLEASL